MTRRSVLVIVALAVLLVASNAWWAYRLLDAGVSATYREVSLENHRTALGQILAIIPIALRPGATQPEILRAAQKDGNPEVFEKDGYVWVGRVGLKFDGAGHLVEVVPAWSPF